MRRTCSRSLGDLVGNDVPKDVFIYLEVLMSHDVTQTGNATPFHFWVPFPHLGWNVFSGLTNDLEVAHHCIERLLVVQEVAQVKAVGVNAGPSRRKGACHPGRD